MTSAITRLSGLEILDSRGRPTVRAVCTLASGAVAGASVPSGASRGAAEAWELRDGDPLRYRGLGCRRAVASISGEIASAAIGREFESQSAFDHFLIALDGTANKARLGANALLAASLAFARAEAVERNIPFYRALADTGGEHEPSALPRPFINLFSGGKHAGGQMSIQDVLISPVSPVTMSDVLVMAVAVFNCAAELVAERYGMRLLTADEGGLAPDFVDAESAFELALEAIARAGLRPVEDVALAVDVAASHFYREGQYVLGGSWLSGEQMIGRLERWARDYSLISIEDGLAEEDWDHWPGLLASLGTRLQIVGDDLLCTNPARIARAIEARAVNTLLLKVNQIGTLTEAADACRLARSAGWKIMVSARSGETEDDWLADLTVGWGGDQIKVGSVTQSERLAKYNRLLAIEAEAGLALRV